MGQSVARKQPTKSQKTERLKRIAQKLREGEATGAIVKEMIANGEATVERTVRGLIKEAREKYDCEPAQKPMLPQKHAPPAEPFDPEAIPDTEEEYREWFGSRYEGPKARALRIMDLEARMQVESGIAYVQLRKLHDETLEKLAPISANVERLFVAVYDEKQDEFILEE